MGPAGMPPRTERDRLIGEVLLAVSLVPAGRVVSYSDVSELVGAHPRQVGQIMAHWAHDVPWWRVTDVRGGLGPVSEARPHWRAEGIGIAADGSRCRFADHHAELAQWADAFDRAHGELPRS